MLKKWKTNKWAYHDDLHCPRLTWKTGETNKETEQETREEGNKTKKKKYNASFAMALFRLKTALFGLIVIIAHLIPTARAGIGEWSSFHLDNIDTKWRGFIVGKGVGSD